MAIARHSLIASEGRVPLFFSAVFAIAGYLFLPIAGVVFTIVYAALVFLFRDPHRDIPSSPLGLVCPVDGVIQQSGPKDDPYLQRPAFRISIRMSVMGVYSVRSPTEGKVIKQWLESTPAFGMKRRSLAIQVRTDEGDEVVTVLRSGRGLRRLRSTLDSGQRVGQGQRFGFIFLGATIDVYLPASSKILVGQGEQVKSGSSLLASLTRH